MLNTNFEPAGNTPIGAAFTSTVMLDSCGRAIASNQCLDCVNIAVSRLGYTLEDIQAIDHPQEGSSACAWCQIDGNQEVFVNVAPPLLSKADKREYDSILADNYRLTVLAEYAKTR